MQNDVPLSLNEQTIRMVVHTTIGGRRVRAQFSNPIESTPLNIGSAHIAVRSKDSEIVPGTDRKLTFNGKPVCTIPPGVILLSDPVDLEVAPLTDLTVSLYFPKDTGPPAVHRLGLHTGYISKGDTTGAHAVPDAVVTHAYLWLSSVDVLAPAKAFAIVALGDSITDGQGSTMDSNHDWPSLLAKRLSEDKRTPHVAVINEGIGGNQVLRDGLGLSALARFDRDVLSRAGVQWMVLLEGVNDLNLYGAVPGTEGGLDAEDLIAGYRQLIERAHTHGIKVIGGTIMPEEGARSTSARGEEIRQSVNNWVRTSHAFDAIVDFDAAVRDPAHPAKLRAEFDPGDHIHQNDAGYRTMAEAFDLAIFRK
jgi:lysophospholipase L1-like esterase